ncbi:DNA primase [Pokkaliibacter plantistimulans]|uniref:DNA primase n=1 Tax=Proteobacteria bacterium 228 TaxID=2083153 RepID=A0A2S5KIK0_9PROT|nr:DNA primase [Pokkaliibacter plantistimulans]PPC74608.1 DNA primase [Pokkaliibacter plantistimulans]
MAGKIPQRFIDDLLSRTDIVDVIDERVPLKKTGKNYSACCPFHQEKSPSFSVSPDKQFYYCFGCGASGNALGFIMEYDRVEFRGAVETLAQRAGLEIPTEAQENDSKEDKLAPILAMLDEVAEWYSLQLKEHLQRDKAISYLRKRGLTGQTAKAFGIGFAPPGWDNVLSRFGTTAARRQALIDAGLLIDKPEEGRCYDRFRDRIMFPIRNSKGKIIGFGGRVLTNEKPKYLNSPETPVFHKNQELYGLYEARKYCKRLERFVIVEGYMDVVMLGQHGLHEAVATLGTATSDTHLRTLFRRVEEVVFCFDGDEAGRKAAERALMTVLPLMEDGRQARFLFLPDGEDPDSLIQQEGLEAFQRRLNRAQSFSDFLFDHIQGGEVPDTAEAKALLSKRALPLIAQIKEGILKQLLMDNLAHITGMDSQRLQHWLEHDQPAPVKDINAYQEPAWDEAHPAEYADYAQIGMPAADDNELGYPPYYTEDEETFSSPMPLTGKKEWKKKGAKKQKGEWKKSAAKHEKEEPIGKVVRMTPCRAAVLTLIRSPEALADLDIDLNYLHSFADSEIHFLLELITYLRHQPEAGFADLAAHFDFANNPSCRFLNQLSEISYQADADDGQRYLRSNLIRLQIDAIQQQYESLQEKLLKQIRFTEEEKQQYRDLQPKRLELQQLLKGQ